MASRKANGEAPDPAVKRCIDLFHDRFVERFAFKPDPRAFGRFGKELKPLLAAWGEGEVAGIIATFFTTMDPQVQRSDYSVGAFLRLAQHLRVQGTKRVVADRLTAKNLDAAARASGRR